MMNRILCSAATVFAVVATGHSQPVCEPDWCRVNASFESPCPATIRAFAWFDDGTGPKLYAGGRFNAIGGAPAENLAIWNGGQWLPVIPGTDAEITALRVLDDGSGPALYVGGRFGSAGGMPATLLAKFDGLAWTPIPGITRDPITDAFSSISDMVIWDAGAGPELYVGGFIGLPGIRQSIGVARLTPSGFATLGSGISGVTTFSLVGVGSLQPADLGDGPALYVGGTFRNAGGLSSPNIARWDGQNWSAVGAGLPEDTRDGSIVPTVRSILPAMDGGTPVLLAAGDFILDSIRGVARWDGQTWTSFPGDFQPYPAKLKFVSEGVEPGLIAYGPFTSIDGAPFSGIARWDGTGWTNVGEPISHFGINALVEFDDGRGPALLAGGAAFFDGCAGQPLARYGRLQGDLDCDGAVSLADLAVLLSAFGVSDAGDLDSDGQTTLEDLTILLSKFGNACGA
ncbi:MAG: hypothetical protein AMXMBFR47_38120 [Planctomycetota bacterium]